MTENSVFTRWRKRASFPPSGNNRTEADDVTAGFTLVELLVVLILTATMATMMMGVLSQLRPIKTIEERARLQRVADRIADVMAEDIRNALPLSLLSGGEDRRPMIGANDRMEFVAVVRTGFRRRGLRDIAYFLADAGHGRKKLVRQTSMRRFNAADLGRASDDLFYPIERLEFQYLARTEDGAEIWQRQWSHGARAARLYIGLRLGRNRHEIGVARVVRF